MMNFQITDDILDAWDQELGFTQERQATPAVSRSAPQTEDSVDQALAKAGKFELTSGVLDQWDRELGFDQEPDAAAREAVAEPAQVEGPGIVSRTIGKALGNVVGLGDLLPDVDVRLGQDRPAELMPRSDPRAPEWEKQGAEISSMLGRGVAHTAKAAWENGDFGQTQEELIESYRQVRDKVGADQEFLKAREDWAEGLPEGLLSVPYSLTTMGASLLGHVVGKRVGGSFGGYLGGAAASGATAYRASRHDFMGNLLLKASQELGRVPTPEEWTALQEKFDAAATKYGMWEAIPEAAGNAMFMGIIGPGSKWAAGKLGEKFGAGLVGRVVKGPVGRVTAGMVGTQAEEQLTEGLTGWGQGAAEAEAGLRDKAPTLAEAYKESAAPTFWMTMITGTSGSVGGHLYDRWKQSGRITDRAGEESAVPDPATDPARTQAATEELDRGREVDLLDLTPTDPATPPPAPPSAPAGAAAPTVAGRVDELADTLGQMNDAPVVDEVDEVSPAMLRSPEGDAAFRESQHVATEAAVPVGGEFAPGVSQSVAPPVEQAPDTPFTPLELQGMIPVSAEPVMRQLAQGNENAVPLTNGATPESLQLAADLSEPAAIAPWQMTQDEYLTAKPDGPKSRAITHERHVREALEQGLPVPPEVLARYKGRYWTERQPAEPVTDELEGGFGGNETVEPPGHVSIFDQAAAFEEVAGQQQKEGMDDRGQGETGGADAGQVGQGFQQDDGGPVGDVQTGSVQPDDQGQGGGLQEGSFVEDQSRIAEALDYADNVTRHLVGAGALTEEEAGLIEQAERDESEARLADLAYEMSMHAEVRDHALDIHERVISRIRKLGGINYDHAREQMGRDGIQWMQSRFGLGFVSRDGAMLDVLADLLSAEVPELAIDREVQNLMDLLRDRVQSKKAIEQDYSRAVDGVHMEISEILGRLQERQDYREGKEVFDQRAESDTEQANAPPHDPALDEFMAEYDRQLAENEAKAEKPRTLREKGKEWPDSSAARVESLPGVRPVLLKTTGRQEVSARMESDLDAAVADASEPVGAEQSGGEYGKERELAESEPENERESDISGRRGPVTESRAEPGSAGRHPGVRSVLLKTTGKQEVPAKIESDLDAAVAVASLADQPQENMVALVLDSKNKPLVILHHSKGATNSTVAERAILAGSVLDVPGARYVYLAHNHPGEKAELSPDSDVVLANVFRDLFKGSGVEMLGMLAITSNSFANELGNNIPIPASGGKGRRVPVQVRVFSGVYEPERVIRLSDPDALIKHFETITGGADSGVILLNNQNAVVGFVPMSPSEMATLRGNGLGNILKALHRANANGVLGIIPGIFDTKAWHNVAALARTADLRVLDVLYQDRSGNLLSFRRNSYDFDGDVDVFFSRAENPTAKGMPAADVQSVVDAVAGNWTRAPVVNVVQSVKDLPTKILGAVRKAGAEGDVQAVYHNGTIHIIADRMADVDHVRRTLLHEGTGHHGLRLIMRKAELIRALDLAWENSKVRDAAGEIASGYELDLSDLDERREAVEEVLAHWAETGVASRALDRFVAAVRRALRRVLPGLKMSDAEVRALIVSARRAVVEGKGARAVAGGGAKMSRNPADIGMITEEIATAIGWQAGPIRLGPDDMTHIAERHQREIERMGFPSVRDFVKHVVENFDAAYQGHARSVLLVVRGVKTWKTATVKMEFDPAGNFWRVVSASPMRLEYFMNELGGRQKKKLLWERAQTNHRLAATPDAFSGQSSYEGNISATDEDDNTYLSRGRGRKNLEWSRNRGLYLPKLATTQGNNKSSTDVDVVKPSREPLRERAPANHRLAATPSAISGQSGSGENLSSSDDDNNTRFSRAATQVSQTVAGMAQPMTPAQIAAELEANRTFANKIHEGRDQVKHQIKLAATEMQLAVQRLADSKKSKYNPLKVFSSEKELKDSSRSRLLDAAMLVHREMRINPGKVQEFKDWAREQLEIKKVKGEERLRILDQLRVLEAAENMTIEQKRFVDDSMNDAFEVVGGQAKNAGVVSTLLDNYVRRLWNRPQDGDKAVFSGAGHAFRVFTTASKARTLETIFDGWMKGYDLQIKGITSSWAAIATEIGEIVANRQFIQEGRAQGVFSVRRQKGYAELKGRGFQVWVRKAGVKIRMRDAYGLLGTDGQGRKMYVAPPERYWAVYAEQGARRADTLFDHEGDARAYADQLRVQGYAKAWVELRQEVDIFEKVPLYAPERVAELINRMTRAMDGDSPWKAPLPRAILAFNNAAKAWILMTSFFHHLAGARSWAFGVNQGAVDALRRGDVAEGVQKMARAINPVSAHKRGLEKIRSNDAVLRQLIRHGLTLGELADWSEGAAAEHRGITDLLFTSLVGRVAGAEKVVEAVRGGRYFRERAANSLFKRYFAGLKAEAAVLEYGHQLDAEIREANREGRTPNPDLVAERVARLVNDDFGGLHLARYGRHPGVQAGLRLLLLAPDWTESNWRTITGMLPGLNDAIARMMHEVPAPPGMEKVYRRFWARIIVVGALHTMLLQVLISGLFGDDDDHWYDLYKEQFADWDSLRRMKWTGVDVTPIYKRLGVDVPKGERRVFSVVGHFADFLRIMDPENLIKGKLSPLMRIVGALGTKTDYRERPFTGVKELVTTGKTVKNSRHLSKEQFFDALPSILAAQIRDLQPIQVGYLLKYLQGEEEGLTALLASGGAHMSAAHKPDVVGKEYEEAAKEVNRIHRRKLELGELKAAYLSLKDSDPAAAEALRKERAEDFEEAATFNRDNAKLLRLYPMYSRVREALGEQGRGKRLQEAYVQDKNKRSTSVDTIDGNIEKLKRTFVEKYRKAG